MKHLGYKFVVFKNRISGRFEFDSAQHQGVAVPLGHVTPDFIPKQYFSEPRSEIWAIWQIAAMSYVRLLLSLC